MCRFSFLFLCFSSLFYIILSNQQSSLGIAEQKLNTQTVETLLGIHEKENQDKTTISINFWNFLLGPMAIKSVVDVGCGRGYATKFFKDNGTVLDFVVFVGMFLCAIKHLLIVSVLTLV